MRAEPIGQRLGRRLREARIAAGLTVREAAARAGMADHSLLVRYEGGAARPPIERVAALAAAYDTTPAALLAAHDAAVGLIAAIERADPASLARLLAALERAEG